MKPTFLLAGIALFLFFGCDVEKTEEGEAPELDIEAEAGEMPEYDVDWANVNVDTRTKTVTVPKLVIVQEEEEVEVPYVNVNIPDSEEDMVERTIMVEAEIAGEMHKLSITNIYATENKLIVVASLESTGENLEGQRVRVSDQVVLNAPENLEVERYIIGAQPTGEFNSQYTYYETADQLQGKLNNAQSLYSRS